MNKSIMLTESGKGLDNTMATFSSSEVAKDVAKFLSRTRRSKILLKLPSGQTITYRNGISVALTWGE